jgi:hypothetical protein
MTSPTYLHVFDPETDQWVPATDDLLASVKAVSLQKSIQASFARPSGGVTYAAGDAVSNSASAPVPISFPAAARVNGGSGLIIGARHVKQSTVAAQFRLWLYRVAPTAVNDDAVQPLLWANRLNRVGFVDFTHTATTGASDSTSAHGIFPGAAGPMPFVTDPAGTGLFGLLQATTSYVAPSAEGHMIELFLTQN